MPCKQCFDFNRPASTPCPECGDVWEMPRSPAIAENPGGNMKVIVDYVGCRTEEIEVTEHTTIRELIYMAAEKMDAPAHFLRVEHVQLNTLTEPGDA